MLPVSSADVKPLIVQGDRSLLLDTSAPAFEEVRDELMRFAELVKSPEYIHTYRITHLSLWNAAAGGLSPSHVLDVLARHSRYPVPGNVCADVRELMGRYGRLSLKRDQGRLVLEAREAVDLAEVLRRVVS